MSQTVSRGQRQISAEDLIDAAERCFSRFGAHRTTMADVAEEAGVHRGTLYRFFDDRDELVMAVLMQASAPLFERAVERLHADEHLESALVTAVSLAIHEALTDQQLTSLFDSTSVRLTAHLASLSNDFLDRGLQATVPTLRLAESSGLLRPGVDPDDAARWLMRVALSFLSTEPPLDLDEYQRLLRTYVTAAIFRGDDA